MRHRPRHAHPARLEQRVEPTVTARVELRAEPNIQERAWFDNPWSAFTSAVGGAFDGGSKSKSSNDDDGDGDGNGGGGTTIVMTIFTTQTPEGFKGPLTTQAPELTTSPSPSPHHAQAQTTPKETKENHIDTHSATVPSYIVASTATALIRV